MLVIKDGIIQNKEIFGIPVKINIIEPSGNRNVRTLIPMNEVIGQTAHNTGNTHPTAGDEMHAKYFQNVEDADQYYVGAHIFVDEDSLTQLIPLNEVVYHAGDGFGDGNRKTISVEICESKNYEKCEHNGKLVLASLNMYYGGDLFPHMKWNGKYCPRRILPRWDAFYKDVFDIVRGESMEYKKVDQKIDFFGREIEVKNVRLIDNFSHYTADNLRDMGLEVTWDSEKQMVKFRFPEVG